jgi:hypothetical protein
LILTFQETGFDVIEFPEEVVNQLKNISIICISAMMPVIFFSLLIGIEDACLP